MEELQKRIIQLSSPLVRLFNWKQTLLTSLIYYVIVGLIFLLVTGIWDWNLQTLILLFSVVYTFVKDFMMERQTTKVMNQQFAYLTTKYPKIRLYVPLLDQVGKTILLKRAALYFTDKWMYLEAFNQKAFSATPKESIKVPYGKGFTIQDVFESSNLKTISFQGTLMNQEYKFITCYDETLLEKVKQVIQSTKGEE